MAAPAGREIVDHLLFHKALIDETDDGTRINSYLEMVDEGRSGEHLSIKDPFDRAISVAFELVIDERFDPWAIDLVRFSSLYLDRLRAEEDIDLVTAGRLVFMAWRILRMQSEDLRLAAEPPAEPEPAWDVAWDDLPDAGWLVDDADYLYTTTVVDAEEAPIDEKVRRKGDRKVTLMELVDALEEAREEAERRQVLNRKREAERAIRRANRVEPESVTHKEDQEADIATVWNRINRFNGHPIPITSLHQPDRDDLVRTFTSLLFLARDERVSVWQEEFPYGMIYVKNLTLGDAGGGDAPEVTTPGDP